MTDEQKQKLIGVGLALAVCYGLYRFVPNAMVKTAAVAVGGVAVAKQVPYLSAALA